MRWLARLLLLAAVGAVVVLILPAAAGADHANRVIENQGPGAPPARGVARERARGAAELSSNLAFWGISPSTGSTTAPHHQELAVNPQEINWTDCNGNQGDIVVWGDILVRAWNTPAPADDAALPAAENCFRDGEPVPVGVEGVHVFDISDLSDPELMGSIELSGR